MRIDGVTSTDLFTGDERRPLQVVQVTLVNEGPAMVRDGGPATVRVGGAGVGTPGPVEVSALAPGESRDVEVPVAVDGGFAEGTRRPVVAVAEWAAGRAELAGEIEVAAPGWTMWMVSHFHYDPVWWNTQGAYTESWLLLPDEQGRLPEFRTAFDLVRLHLDGARRDPDYKFVLAEVDYLKPHWDAYPEDRADLRRFLAEGRVEIVGGNYNEANTNLTSTESTIRNAVYGIGYQRDVVGGDPHSAWMLDVFGHDPSYPGLMADAGLTSSSWARGPFHQWGPHKTIGDNTRMQFPSEFEWISPTGRGLLTSYMANHYGAGWEMERHATLEAASAAAYAEFAALKPVAGTRNVLLPVGGDHVIPSRWCTEIHRDWNKRYVWPRFVVALPRDFFAAVRTEAAGPAARRITPQTRDMNPVYPGKDVSYIDTKQAQRAAETAVMDGERLATLASLLGARFPSEALDKAWRQLCFGAHHDGITGSESDQVYLDLLGGWREACELGAAVRDAAADHIAGCADTRGDGRPVVVTNTLARPRDGVARVRLAYDAPGPVAVALQDGDGATVPTLADGIVRHADGSLAELTLTFVAPDVPALGYRTYHAVPAAQLETATPIDGHAVENDAYRVVADPARGGALVSIVDRRTGRELLRPAAVGNDLYLQEEYPDHPRWNEGPWLLLPKGPGRSSAALAAEVHAVRTPVGERLTVTYNFDDLRVTQEVICWAGVDRVDFRTHVDGSIGQDRLLRVRFGMDVPGALPIHEVGNAVVGRTFGTPDADAGPHAFPLDSPAYTWFGVGSTARVTLHDPDGSVRLRQAIGVAEIVATDEHPEAVRELVARLAGQGVTATCSRPEGPRYGSLDLDSNLPDVRIVLGADNAFATAVLDAADPAYAEVLRATGRVWVPAARPRAETFVPSADVRGTRDLPVLIVTDAELAALTADLADSTIEVTQPATLDGSAEPVADYAVALLNRGIPGCVAAPDGTLYLNLMRSCSGWPAGVWIDGERRTVPDGSSFQWQHWTHTFEYALVSGAGDWREAGFVTAGHDYNHDLLARGADAHPGRLPGTASLFAVEPAGSVELTALKPRGNPLATGRPDEVTAADGITVRCYETTGRPATARVHCFTGLDQAAQTDLLEEREHASLSVSDGVVEVPLSPADTVTLTARPTGGPAGRAGEPFVEPAQPVFTRYWLHGKGAAPVGYLPVAVHVAAPASLDGATMRVTVATGTVHATGRVDLLVPPELSAAPVGDLAYDLAPGDHMELAIPLTARSDAAAGTYAVGARIRDPLGQQLEDVGWVTVGSPSAAELLEATLETDALRLSPGGRGEIGLRLANRSRSEIRGEAQLLSPYGTWAATAPWTQGFAVAPGAGIRLAYDVRLPADTRPGSHWWALVKVMYFGRLHYTKAVPIEVL